MPDVINRKRNRSNKLYKIHSSTKENSHIGLINVDAEFCNKQFLGRKLVDEKQIRVFELVLKLLIIVVSAEVLFKFFKSSLSLSIFTNALSSRHDIKSNHSYRSTVSTYPMHCSILPRINANNTSNLINMNRHHSNIPTNNIYQSMYVSLNLYTHIRKCIFVYNRQ